MCNYGSFKGQLMELLSTGKFVEGEHPVQFDLWNA